MKSPQVLKELELFNLIVLDAIKHKGLHVLDLNYIENIISNNELE